MPLSEIQAEVLRRIAVNRSPESYLAGATVLHRARNTPRFSQDVDLFHDLEEQVVQNAEKDAATLVAAGYGFSWLQRTPFFCRAVVTVKNSRLKMEWAQDSAFRFFPLWFVIGVVSAVPGRLFPDSRRRIPIPDLMFLRLEKIFVWISVHSRLNLRDGAERQCENYGVHSVVCGLDHFYIPG